MNHCCRLHALPATTNWPRLMTHFFVFVRSNPSNDVSCFADQVLLAMSAQVEDRGQKNDCTPLMEAASAGHVDIIHLLISHNADVNAQSSTGNTPLMYACAGGHVDAVRDLLKSGAHVEDHNENGHTPLMEAASAGHVEVAKVIVMF